MTDPHYATIEWFNCAICGARQDMDWKHDSPHGPLCPNCWRFHEGDTSPRRSKKELKKLGQSVQRTPPKLENPRNPHKVRLIENFAYKGYLRIYPIWSLKIPKKSGGG